MNTAAITRIEISTLAPVLVNFTLSASPEDTAPNIQLAILHGVLGQIFFAMMIAMAVFTSPSWIAAHTPQPVPSAAADRVLTALLSGALIIQLVLGAILRHIAHGLLIHISAAAIVAALAIIAGVRAWGLYPNEPPAPGPGLAEGHLAAIGIGALRPGRHQDYGLPINRPRRGYRFTTAHQVTGALLLALTVALMLGSGACSQPVHNLSPPRPEARPVNQEVRGKPHHRLSSCRFDINGLTRTKGTGATMKHVLSPIDLLVRFAIVFLGLCQDNPASSLSPGGRTKTDRLCSNRQ